MDWDEVLPAPLKVASISIGDKLFQTNPRVTLASDQDMHFRKELRRIEQERSNSSWLSRLFMDSEENRFLSDILTRGRSFRNIQEHHPRILQEAIGRTPQTIAMAAAEWNAFAKEFYTGQGLPVPDWPQYIEIQESLGVYGRTPTERNLRKLKRWISRLSYIFVYGVRNSIERFWPWRRI